MVDWDDEEYYSEYLDCVYGAIESDEEYYKLQ